MNAAFLRIWSATLLLYLASGMVFPAFSLYMAYRGLSDLEVGIVASAATLISLLSAALLGLYSDMVANREILQGFIGVAIALVLATYLHAHSFPGFVVLHPTYMSLLSPYMTLSGAVAMDYITGSRGGLFGRFRTSGAAGWIIGTMLGGYVLSSLGYVHLFIVSSAFFLASAALYMYGGLKRGGFHIAGGGGLKRPIPWRVLTNSRLYPLLISVLVASIGNPAYYTFLPLFMTKDLEASPFVAYLAFSATPLAEIPAMVYLGSLSDRIGRRRVILICLSAYPVRFLLTGLSPTPHYAIVVQLLHGLTFGGLYVASTAYITESVRDDERGFALSLYTITANMGGFIGSYALAHVITILGFRAMYMVAALISGFSIPLFMILGRASARQP